MGDGAVNRRDFLAAVAAGGVLVYADRNEDDLFGGGHIIVGDSTVYGAGAYGKQAYSES